MKKFFNSALGLNTFEYVRKQVDPMLDAQFANLDIFHLIYKSLIEGGSTAELKMIEFENEDIGTLNFDLGKGSKVKLRLLELNENQDAVLDKQTVEVEVTEALEGSCKVKVISTEKPASKYIGNAFQSCIVIADNLGWELVYPKSFTKDNFVRADIFNDPLVTLGVDYYVVKPKIDNINNCYVIRKVKDAYRVDDFPSQDEMCKFLSPNGVNGLSSVQQNIKGFLLSKDRKLIDGGEDRSYLQILHLYNYDDSKTLEENIELYEVEYSVSGYVDAKDKFGCFIPNVSIIDMQMQDYQDKFSSTFDFNTMMPIVVNDDRGYFVYGDDKFMLFGYRINDSFYHVFAFGAIKTNDSYVFMVNGGAPLERVNDNNLFTMPVYSEGYEPAPYSESFCINNMFYGLVNYDTSLGVTKPDDPKFYYENYKFNTLGGDINIYLSEGVDFEKIKKLNFYDVYLTMFDGVASSNFSLKMPYIITGYPAIRETGTIFELNGKRYFNVLTINHEVLTLPLEV